MVSGVQCDIDHKDTDVLIHRTLWYLQLQGYVVVLTRT